MNRRLKMAAVAALGCLASGCNLLSHSSNAPAQAHVVRPATHARPAVSLQKKAAPFNPHNALASAIRTTLNQRSSSITRAFVLNGIADAGIDPNPLLTEAGVFDFVHDTAKFNEFFGPTANQPNNPLFSAVVKNDKVYLGTVQSFLGDEPMIEFNTNACSTVDSGVDVLHDVVGKISYNKTTLPEFGQAVLTHFRMSVDLGQALLDCSSGKDSLGKQLRGVLATRDVWIDSENRIVRYNEHVDLGKVQLGGLPAKATSIDVRTTLTNFGVGVVVVLPKDDGRYKVTATLD